MRSRLVDADFEKEKITTEKEQTMPKQKWLRMYGSTFLIVFATLLLPFPSNGQESSSLLTYSLTAKPGNLQVNRMPGTNPPVLIKKHFPLS